LKESGVPWAHRAKLGRARAYVRTVWWMLLDSKFIRWEAAKPQSPADGRVFQRITFVLLAAFSITVFATSLSSSEGLSIFALEKPYGRPITLAYLKEGIGLDFALPWSAGATRPGLLIVCLFGFVYSLVSSPRSLFATKSLSASGQQLGATLATYAFSPMVFFLPSAAFAYLASWLERSQTPSSVISNMLSGPGVIICVTLAGISALLAVFGALVRPLQWFSRVAHTGGTGRMLAAVRWTYTFVGLTLFWLGLVPWCVGYLWIVFDSFRP